MNSRGEFDFFLKVNEIVAAKNRFFHRSGFSPFQLVFGKLPRLPHEFLSDDAIDAVGLADISSSE